MTAIRSGQGRVLHNSNAFELYGFDIMVDSALKPWLIEINASPSLLTTTKRDKKMKKKLIKDLLGVVMPRKWGEGGDKRGAGSCEEDKVGGFEMIYDQTRDNFYKKTQKIGNCRMREGRFPYL